MQLTIYIYRCFLNVHNSLTFTGSVLVAECLALQTSDHMVPSFNPERGRIQLDHDCMAFHCAEPFITIPSSRYDFNNVEM